MNGLTVQQLAKLSGVTVRTLHYYDEVGLLKPSYVKENGYRYYDTDAQLILQQILFFKELDFSLEQIQKAMKVSDGSRLEILEDQKKLLHLKRRRMDRIIKTIDTTITEIKGGGKSMSTSNRDSGRARMTAQDSGQSRLAVPLAERARMTNNDLFKSFDVSEIDRYHDEAKKRWGNTDAWRQSQERTKHWTKEDYQRLQEDGDKFMKEFVTKMHFGIGSVEVQEEVEKIYQQLHTFYDPTIEMFRNLGQMYVDDPRFTAYYEKYASGLAVFMRDAIAIYCDRQEKKS